MIYSLSCQMYKYEHGLSAAEQRAADVRAGEVAAALRNLRLSLGRALRPRHRGLTAPLKADAVPGSRAAAPARVLSGIR